jgi:hypothetical protein
MNTLIKTALVTVTVGAASLIGVPAQAATEHCPRPAGSVKIETDGASNTVKTKLAPGTQVCVKAGTKITYVTVSAKQTITQTKITNKKGKPLGISYYVAIPCKYKCVPDYPSNPY